MKVKQLCVCFLTKKIVNAINTCGCFFSLEQNSTIKHVADQIRPCVGIKIVQRQPNRASQPEETAILNYKSASVRFEIQREARVDPCQRQCGHSWHHRLRSGLSAQLLKSLFIYSFQSQFILKRTNSAKWSTLSCQKSALSSLKQV